MNTCKLPLVIWLPFSMGTELEEWAEWLLAFLSWSCRDGEVGADPHSSLPGRLMLELNPIKSMSICSVQPHSQEKITSGVLHVVDAKLFLKIYSCFSYITICLFKRTSHCDWAMTPCDLPLPPLPLSSHALINWMGKWQWAHTVCVWQCEWNSSAAIPQNACLTPPPWSQDA